MPQHYSTQLANDRDKSEYWSGAVSQIFFPLSAQCHDAARFSGHLQVWDLNTVSLSHFQSDAISYQRERHHLVRGAEEQILITFVGRSAVEFTQDDVELHCGPSQFFIQRGHQPYQLLQRDDNELWVLKLPAALLARRVRSIDTYAPYVFDAGAGVGGLLLDTLRLLPGKFGSQAPLPEELGGYVVDLLGLALEGNTSALGSRMPIVQAAHLARVQRFIRRNLAHPSLSPAMVAAGCGLSVRYLHELFRHGGVSVSRWIRELRLDACDAQLRSSQRRDSIAGIAYRWGFTDQAQFSRHYRARFGHAPRDARDAARTR
jgi:AraC-like DNA-binding protein